MYRLVGVLLLHRELSTDRAVYLDNFKFLSASPPVVSNLLLMNEGTDTLHFNVDTHHTYQCSDSNDMDLFLHWYFCLWCQSVSVV